MAADVRDRGTERRLNATDTIFAVASGRPPAALAIIRISGPAATAAGRTIAGTLPPPRQAGVRQLRDGDGAWLDEALVLVFPAPRSATGEDVVELHCHGGRAVIAAVERWLAALPDLRLAQPGEFTRRALRNGRIDLAEAQGLADLLEAETEEQRRAAAIAVGGRLSRQIAAWTELLNDVVAAIEADLNFADDEGTGADIDLLRTRLRSVADEIDAALRYPPAERLRDGVRVVLAGPPNAGKSTLFNRLAGRAAAIVSPIAGTTRDRIEAPVTYAGRAFLLIDTAGLNEAADPIEAEGVRLAEEAMAGADIVLWLGDDPAPGGASATLAIHARADEPARAVVPPGRPFAVALRDDAIITRLWKGIIETASQLRWTAGDLVMHQDEQKLAKDARDALYEAIDSDDPVLIAEGIRRATLAFDRIRGYDATEAMLDRLFGRFCIGK